MKGLLNTKPVARTLCPSKLASRTIRAVPAPVQRSRSHVVRVAMEEQTSTSFELIGVTEEGLPMPVAPVVARLFDVNADEAEEYGEPRMD